MHDTDRRAGWRKALEAAVPLLGTLMAFLLMMVLR
jgi:hypothetical protein